MVRWPDEMSIAFAPIVAWETWPESLGTARSHQNTSQRPNPTDARYEWDMWVVYDHQYGETEGLPRLLDLFDAHGVKATFVPNGKRLEDSPDLAREVARRGHDMGSENYVHEYPIMYTREEERQSLEDTITACRKVVGSAPTGYISPGHRPSPNTIPLLLELGYRWDADFQNGDTPFLLREADQRLVCMPYAHMSDYLTYSRQGRSPRQILEMMVDEFDVLRAEGRAGKPKMMGFAIHPFLCHGFRTVIIDKFLSYIAAFSDVWIPTRLEITEWVLANPEVFATRSLQEVLADFPAARQEPVATAGS